MSHLPTSITKAIESLSDLPGIGHRSAERLIFSLLKNKTDLDQKIAKNIGLLKPSITECDTCFHYCDRSETDKNYCPICKDSQRDTTTICIVETPLDLIAMERTHEFQGVYHVLHGVISPLNKVLPDDIQIQPFCQRIKETKNIREIVFALASNIESEATSHFIVEKIKPFFKGKITKLARGIPSGGDLDYLDAGTIGRAILERRDF